MDTKRELIDNVLNALIRSVNNRDVLDLVNDVLELALSKYNVEKAVTDLIVYDSGFEAVLKRYIVCKEIAGLSRKSLERYYSINKRLLAAVGKPLKEITTDDIRIYMANERLSGRISNRTLDGMRLCYNGFFGWAWSEGLIDHNPMLSIERIKYKKSIKKPFSAVEMEQIRKSCTCDRDRALVEFLATTGVRVSECSSINIPDVDFTSNELVVLGKGNKERTVYISDVAALHLNTYLSGRNDTNPALFVGRRGRLSKCGIERILKRIENISGVQNVHPHRFRRTLATSLLNHGMDIVAVAEILGHCDIRTTQIYCSVGTMNVKYAYHKITAA